MKTLECIQKRQSIRKYLSSPIPDSDIEAILRAGMEAPSAMNRRPYDFVLNTDNVFWKELVSLSRTAGILATCPLTVLVVADLNKNPSFDFAIEDGSIVAENMLLAATELGYGSLWNGVKWDSDYEKALIASFAIPMGHRPIAVLGFGKADETKPLTERYDETKIHYGKF
jgi:nitroreductase